MKRIVHAVLGGIATMSIAGTAHGQAIPNYGNYEALTGNYRVGVQVSAPVLAQPLTATFEQPTIEEAHQYLDPSGIRQALIDRGTQATLATQLATFGDISAAYDLAGAPALAGYALNSQILNLRFVNADGTVLLDKAGVPCSFSYNGLTRQQSWNAFDADLDTDSPTMLRIEQCIAISRSRNSPIDTVVGNPQSLQGQMARSALDLAEGDSLVEVEPGANSAGDPWVIGASWSTGSAGRFDMDRVDARVAKGWRVFEGNRARLKLDLPFNWTRINGASSFAGQIGLGLEYPIQPNWSLEPRVAYGATVSPDLGSGGHIVQGSVASRYAIRGLGRGTLLIGNMVGYAATLATPGDVNLNPDVKAWTFRNGVSYDLPLKGLVAGRSTSVRGSYTFTNYAGTKLYNKNFHEFTLSFGLRGREDTPKQFRDVVRLSLNTVQARGYSTYTVGLGFRF